MAMLLQGRVNFATRRTRQLFLLGAGGAAALVSQLVGLAGRAGEEFAAEFRDALDERMGGPPVTPLVENDTRTGRRPTGAAIDPRKGAISGAIADRQARRPSMVRKGPSVRVRQRAFSERLWRRAFDASSRAPPGERANARPLAVARGLAGRGRGPAPAAAYVVLRCESPRTRATSCASIRSSRATRRGIGRA
jgi:hypothetical protein